MLQSIANDPALTALGFSILLTSVIVLGHIVNMMVFARDVGTLRERLLFSSAGLLVVAAQIAVLLLNLPQ